MDKVVKKKLISEYKEGESTRDIFVVKLKKGIQSYVKGFYFSLVLTDSSGKSLEYRYWGDDDEERIHRIYDPIIDDSVVYLEGQFTMYQGKLQLTSSVEQAFRVLEKDQYNEVDFIKKSKKDIEEMYLKLRQYIDKITNEKLKLLLDSIFSNGFIEDFKKHPAAMSVHHNWVGGLLEHTLEVIRYCETSKEIFPSLDLDLLITGAILHDIGKLEEMGLTSRIKWTNEGMFVGHLVLGTIYVSKKMDELGLESELKNKVLHMMVSHHGKIENGSPREPMFPEALALYHADETSSKLAEMINFIDDSKEESKEDFAAKWKKDRPANVYLK